MGKKLIESVQALPAALPIEYEQAPKKKIKLRLFGFLVGVTLTTIAAIANPSTALATAATPDVSNSVELTAKEGSATIVEHDDGSGTNQVSTIGTEAELKFTNDLDSYTRVTTENTETGDKTEQLYRTEDEQTITLPKDAPTPDPSKVEKTESEQKEGDTQKVTKEVVPSENAIQKAIDKAMESLTNSSKSITISVAAGEYNGNITIDSSKATAVTDTNFWETFVLNLVADDAYTKPSDASTLIDQSTFNANSKGLVHVNGSITINGVTVQIVGVYFSDSSTTTVDGRTVTIIGTVKDDTVVVVLSGSGAAIVKTGDGNDVVTVSGKADSAASSPENNTVQISTGKGDDIINVDLSAANNAQNIEVDGEEGHNRLHFTGTLKKIEDNQTSNNKVELDSNGDPTVELENSDSKILKMVMSNIQDFTDDLKNKQEVELKLTDATQNGDIWVFSLDKPFTNYVFKVAESAGFTVKQDGLLILGNLRFDTNAGFLCNVLIQPGEHEYGVKNVTADGLNLYIKGRQLTIFGIVVAQIITIEAYDEDINLRASETFVADIPLLGDQVKDQEISIIDINTKVFIKVVENAKVIATGSVFMSASAKLTHGWIPSAGYNFVTVKIGDVFIIIDGEVTAGGRLQAKAEQEVKIEVSNKDLAEYYVPLTVSVVISETGVKVGEKAVVKASSSVELTAKTNISITAKTTAGKLPLSIAVGVVVVDTYVEVEGSVESTNDNINISATGIVKLIASATGKVAETKETTGTGDKDDQGNEKDTKTDSSANNYGGYVAVSVVIQDVWVKIIGGGTLTAGGDITLTAKADERVTTKAIANDPNASKGKSSDGSSDGKSDSDGNSMKKVTDALGSIFKVLKEKFTGKEDKLDKAENGLASTNGNKITAENIDNGAVSASQRAKSGETVSVKVNPNDGYKLGSLTATYLLPGDTSYTTITINASNGKYSFTMPDAEVTLKASWVALASGETTPPSNDDDSPYGEGKKDNNLTDALDGGTNGSDGSSDTKTF